MHHPHNDSLVVTTTIRNMNIHRTLVGNGSSVDILYLGAYEQMGLGQHQLTPMPTPLYGLTGDSLTPIRSNKLAMMVCIYPRISTVMANFLVVDYPLVFNLVLGRSILKELQVVTSIHHLLMKFPMLNGVGQLRECQSEGRECYNKPLKTVEKDKKWEQALVVSDQRLASSGLISENLDPHQLEDEVKIGPLEGLVKVVVYEHEPTRVLKLGENLGCELKQELTYFLKANLDVFAWTSEDMVRIHLDIICHQLNISTNFKHVQQKRRAMDAERYKAMKTKSKSSST